jgi:hypothetical protein
MNVRQAYVNPIKPTVLPDRPVESRAGRFEPDHFRCRPTVQAPNERNARFVAKAVAGLGPGPTAKAIVSARLELAIACSPKR